MLTGAHAMKLVRWKHNPILKPNPQNQWENFVTTNPGAWYDAEEGQIKLLYRAAGDEEAHIIRFGLAVSPNGYDFTRVSEQPVFAPSIDGFDAGCVEDPRIVKIGDYYYITYAARFYPPGRYWMAAGKPKVWRQSPPEFPYLLRENAAVSGLAVTKDFKTWIRAGRITNPLVDDRDVILFPEKVNGKFVMLHRPMNWAGPQYKTAHPAIWISFSEDLLHWPQSTLLAAARQDWETKIGGNTPPIRTPYGWLTLYHAVGPDRYYRLGAFLLDLENPAIVTHRTKDWIFQPEEWYEIEGCYDGGGVVFPCGKVVIRDTLFVYYGAADKYIGLATCKLDELLDYLLDCPAN